MIDDSRQRMIELAKRIACIDDDQGAWPTDADDLAKLVLEHMDKKLPIIGRERWLLDDLSKGLKGVIGGPPPSKATMDRVRRHNSSSIYDTHRGSRFEVQLVGQDTKQPTGHIVLVTVELDRFEEVGR